MKLTAFTDYCLRVLIYLAAKPGHRATVSEICAAFGINANHLTKVVHHLGRRGWVETTRGKGGGVLLARPARSIGVGDVVRDAEGQAMPAECFGNPESRCVIFGCCPLKSVLGEAVKAFYAVLNRHTLADITHDPSELSRILDFHPGARRAIEA